MTDLRRAGPGRRRALLILLWRSGGWRLLGVGLLTVLQGLAPIGSILATGVLLGALGSPSDARLIAGLILFGGAALVGAVLSPVLDYLVRVLDGWYGHTVHETVARATLGTAGVTALEDPRIVGELAALAEFERVDGFVSTVSNLRELVRRRTTGLAAAALLISFAWWAPLVLLVAWRGLGFGIQRWIDHGVGVSAKVGAERLRRPRYLRELAVDAPSAKEVRLFGLADWLVADYVANYRSALRQIWAGRALGMRTIWLGSAAVLAAHLAVLAVAGTEALDGTQSVARLVVTVQLVLSSSALGFLGDPEQALGRARQVAWQALGLAATLLPPGESTSAGRAPVDRAVGESSRNRAEPIRGRLPGGPAEPLPVRLAGVRFRYPGQPRPILDGLDLAIPAGQSIAIVGANGAGKSTLIKLLCGLYQPERGEVTVGGEPPGNRPGRISVIFQNFTRYQLPLRANVGFGSRRADDDAIERALAAAGAVGLPDQLPAGLDTVLSAGYSGGQDLSGGQWQKVALARALTAVRYGAGLLILDEPTAALDIRAEVELFDRFRAATAGVTTILVSHRLASVCRADRIVVLADGRLVEDGSHAELLAAGGRYAEMFTLQAKRFGEAEAAQAEAAQAEAVGHG